MPHDDGKKLGSPQRIAGVVKMTSNNGEGDRKAEKEGDGEELIGKIEAVGDKGELERK